MIRAALLASCALVLLACSSAPPAEGPRQVALITHPPGARYWTSDGREGTTPDTIPVERGVHLEVYFALEGFAFAQAVVPADPKMKVERTRGGFLHEIDPHDDGSSEQYSYGWQWNVVERGPEERQRANVVEIELLPVAQEQ